MTAREYAQTLELLELHGIAHQVVGPAHGGAGAFGKARAMAGRLPALRRFAKGRRFDLALAHGSHEAMLVGAEPRDRGRDRTRLRVRDDTAPARTPGCDTGGLPRRRSARPSRPARRKAAEAPPVPGDRGGVLPRGLRARSGRPRRHRSRERARRRADAAGRVALPPPRQPALPGLLDRLGRDEPVHAVVLPRTGEQREAIRALGLPSLHLPEHAIDAQSLVGLADLVVSAGGTMNREAVALGTPVYTTFAGRLGAVDEPLIREGRLRPLTSPPDSSFASASGAGTRSTRSPRAARPAPVGLRAGPIRGRPSLPSDGYVWILP